MQTGNDLSLSVSGPDSVEFFDPVAGQIVLGGAVADQGDVAQRGVAVFGQAVGDQAEGAQGTSLAVFGIEPERIIAPARNAFR